MEHLKHLYKTYVLYVKKTYAIVMGILWHICFCFTDSKCTK